MALAEFVPVGFLHLHSCLVVQAQEQFEDVVYIPELLLQCL